MCIYGDFHNNNMTVNILSPSSTGTQYPRQRTSWLHGLLTYYGKFLLNVSTHLALLYKLLRKIETWKWTAAQDEVLKELLTTLKLLVHFLLLASDASVYGIMPLVLCWPIEYQTVLRSQLDMFPAPSLRLSRIILSLRRRNFYNV